MDSVNLWPLGGGGYSHTLPLRVCAAKRGRDVEVPDLEQGIQAFSATGYNISNAQKLHRLLLKYG